MFIIFRLFVFFCLVLTSLTYATAKQQDYRAAVTTNLAGLNVSGTNASGNFVSKLTSEQFEVFDNKIKQKIKSFSDTASGFSIGIVYDARGVSEPRLLATLNALKLFAQTLDKNDNLFLFAFDENDFFLITFNEDGGQRFDFISNPEQVNIPLSPLSTKSSNSLFNVVNLAAGKMLSTRNAKKVLLIISGGVDHNSDIKDKELRNLIGSINAQVYTIAIETPETFRNQNAPHWVFEDLKENSGLRFFLQDADAAFRKAVLDSLARVADGISYVPKTESDKELMGICVQIIEELRR